uniref:hAT-like transposase RNase-H fold domain-containing protein n=1 Tax=Lactuca sativa TaxID=4236 RepID=A0A9R1XJ84_LACSA|nr:hypothetical protein LSAT_V11C400189830 [Lactuca sativa]
MVTFLDATSRFLGSKYVTSNAYAHEIYGIHKVIDGFTMHPDKSIMAMEKIKLKYNKYWGNITNLDQFIFIGLVLDLRRKWQYIQWVVIKAEEYSSSVPQNEKDGEVSSTSSPSDPNSVWGMMW